MSIPVRPIALLWTGFAALERPLHPVEQRQAGPLPWLHWPERGRRGAEWTDEFFAVDLPSAEAIGHVRAAAPSPYHLVAEVAIESGPDPDAWQAAGYEFGSCEPIMIRSLTGGTAPDGSTRRVRTMEEVARILAAHAETGYPQRLFTPELLADPHISIRTIWDDDRFVAIGKAALLPDGAYLTDIMTMPAYRKRGHGAAIVRALEADAIAAGCRTALLTSTAMARSLYQSLGYREIGTNTLYIAPE
jgi:ribosomal protein S18 acetylase RimI-like enzyme